jgi:hypothetical protein
VSPKNADNEDLSPMGGWRMGRSRREVINHTRRALQKVSKFDFDFTQPIDAVVK